ncbi:MAG: metallophosphoesterase family protein [Nanoarchaeota archaeon]
MKIVYASDLHSNKTHFLKIKKITYKVTADLLILGGDLFAHTHDVSDQISFIKNFLKDYINDFNIPVLGIAGNVDWPLSINRLNSTSKIKILNLNFNYLYQSIYFEGYPFIVPSPFKNKDFEKRDLKNEEYIYPYNKNCYVTNELGKKIYIKKDYLNSLISIEEDLNRKFEPNSIWIMHNPPYGGDIDLADHAGHIGSKAIRDKIRKEQPKLTLHGHVHESPTNGSWIDSIKNTICINPGCGTKVHAVIIKLDDDFNLKRIRHTIYGTY